ncbi:MAG TPA: sigma-70 family RNA polymerase sigma factor [Bacteroidota bacterium]|nr:sigma-70 family RNA polymerase sigma factor [Bacteroidota bacterium]
MSPSLSLVQSDERILQRIRDGDEETLVLLYRVNRRAVEAFIGRNSGTSDDADDLLQEALVVLWERVRSGRFEQRAQLSTFLYATVKNLWFRRLARKKREIATELDPEQTWDGQQSALEDLVDDEAAARVQRALRVIGEPCRSLLLLFYWEERSMEEIAAALGFANADTAKAKKYQCKKMLEKLLKEI